MITKDMIVLQDVSEHLRLQQTVKLSQQWETYDH